MTRFECCNLDDKGPHATLCKNYSDVETRKILRRQQKKQGRLNRNGHRAWLTQ